MSFRDYLDLIKAKYTDAETKGDRDEMIRLLGLLRDVCIEQIVKVERR